MEKKERFSVYFAAGCLLLDRGVGYKRAADFLEYHTSPLQVLQPTLKFTPQFKMNTFKTVSYTNSLL
jgi:hypothetical protein